MIGLRIIGFMVLLVGLVSLPVHAETNFIDNYQLTASYSEDDGEELVLYFTLLNGNDNLKGLELEFEAESADYVFESRLGGKQTEELNVQTSEVDGMVIATVLFPEVLEKGSEKEMEIKFKTQGLVNNDGPTSTIHLNFDFVKGITEDDERITIPAKPGIIKIHVPAGYLHTDYEPEPWREIWQGVSGYDSHFVIIYDTVPLTQDTMVTFEESDTVAKASRVDVRIDEAGSSATSQQKNIAEAHLAEAIDLLLSDTEDKVDKADAELELALEALSTPASTPSGQDEDGESKGICGPIAMLIMGILPKIRPRCLK